MKGSEVLPTPARRSLERLSLRANFSWTFVGNIVYAGCQWGMLVALAKLTSPEHVGQFALGLAVSAPIMMFANLQLRDIQATDAGQEYQFADYLGLRLITTTLAFLCIIASVLAFAYRWEVALVVIIIGAAKAIEAISDIFNSLLQRNERMDRVARSLIFKGLLSLIAMTGGTYLSGSVIWGAVGMACAWLIVLIGYDLRNAALVLAAPPEHHAAITGTAPARLPWCPRWEAKTLLQLVRLALPLGIVMMLVSLSSAMPRYFIERYLGERELGIFAAIAYLQVAGTTVVSALASSAIPRLATHYQSGEVLAFRNLLMKLAGIGALLGAAGVIVALFAGHMILSLIYRPEYGAYNTLFVLVMTAASAGYVAWFLGDGMTAARYLRVQVLLFSVVVAATALACLWLIPTMGLIGAGLALIVAGVIQMLGGLIVNVYAIAKLQRRMMRY